MKRGKAVQNRLVSKSLQAILACAAIVLAPTVEAAAYYEAGARAWSYYLPARDADDVFSTSTEVYASASSAGGSSGAGSIANANAWAGPGYIGAYAYGAATNAGSYAEATSGGSFVLSDLVFSSANSSNTQVTTSLNFTIGGNVWGSHAEGTPMHSRGGTGIGWRLKSGSVTYLSADGGLTYWSSETDPGIQLVQATGVLADLSSMPPGYDWSYTSLLPLGGQTTITLSNITLDLGRVYELTAWINSEVQSGLSATNGAQTVLGVDFGHTMSFPTSGAVFNLPEGFSVNSADGAIVNNQWIDPRPAAVVPVPATVWLFGSGLLGLVGMARRKKTYMISKNNYKLLSRLICRVALFAPLAVPISIQAAPVLGTPSNNVSASASGGAVGIVWDSCGNPSLSGSNPVGYSCEAGNVSGAFNMIGSASAGMGAVHLGTSATAGTVGTDSYSGSTNASAYLADYFAISGPANSTGHLYGSFVVDGNLSVGVGGSALSSTAAMSSYSIQASLAGVNTERSGSWTLATNGYDQQSNISGSVLPIDASISFGSDGWAVIALSIYGQANSNGNAVAYQQCSTCVLVPGSFSTAATFGNTIYWGGISSVTVNGSPLTNFEFISASGADYRYATAPIPIPAAAWLFGSGLLGLIGVARRKRCR